MLICGYVVPFGRHGMLGGFDRWTVFAPGAFETFARRGGSVDVRSGSHAADAPRLANTENGTAGIFTDDYGLGFWARVEDRNWRITAAIRAMTRTDRPENQCSGNFIIRKKRPAGLHAGLPVDIVTEAAIDHIAVVESGVYGAATGVWPADWVDHAPWRIRGLAERWTMGAERWNRDLVQAVSESAAARERAAAKAMHDRWTKPGSARAQFTTVEARRVLAMFGSQPIGIAPAALKAILRERRL